MSLISKAGSSDSLRQTMTTAISAFIITILLSFEVQKWQIYRWKALFNSNLQVLNKKFDLMHNSGDVFDLDETMSGLMGNIAAVTKILGILAIKSKQVL